MTRPLRLIPALARVCTCVFAVLLAQVAHGAEPWGHVQQVGPFICHATFPLDEYRIFFAELPELQRELSRTLGLPPANQPISIYLFKDQAEHQKFLTENYPHVPYRRALFVKEGGRAGVYAYRHEETEIDLRHECTHALLHSVLPSVPLWLDEGLAEYFEVPASRRAFDHSHFDSLRWNMRLGMVQSIENLERRENLSDMSGYDYRYSWAWVHFMLHGPEPAHRCLVKYLAHLRAADPSAPPAGAVRQVTYLERAEGAAHQNFEKMLSEVLPNPTERLVQHFKFWHR